MVCEIAHDDMQFPLAKRISYPQRSLESILAAGGDRKKFKDYYNCTCVAEGMFDIPLSHVYLYSTLTIELTTSLFSLRVLGMPTWTQGIFTKIYELLEDACHSLDLQLGKPCRK